MRPTRLAIIAGHPVQYVAPWLAQLAEAKDVEIHVFYLWDFGVVEAKDPGFGITLEWDIPLLEGYSYSFIPNISSDPGNHHFMGYINPTLACLMVYNIALPTLCVVRCYSIVKVTCNSKLICLFWLLALVLKYGCQLLAFNYRFLI